MADILPAIIAEDFADLTDKMSIAVSRVPMVHIDVEDSTLTTRSTWPYQKKDVGEGNEFLRITEEVEGFPFWEELEFEAHLMVKDPLEISEDWVRAGAERLIVHYESFDDKDSIGETILSLRKKFNKNESFVGVEVGLALNMETPIGEALPHIVHADFLHLMSIEKIGSQGEEFNSRTLERIKEVKAVLPETIISVDGGVNMKNIDDLIEAGVDRFIIGGAIYNAEDPETALEEFVDLN